MVIHHAVDPVISSRGFECEYSNDAAVAFARCGLARGFDFAAGRADVDLAKGDWEITYA